MQPVRTDALDQLRHQVAKIEADAPRLPDAELFLPLGIRQIDSMLGGGLAFGAVHELAPALPIHVGGLRPISPEWKTVRLTVRVSPCMVSIQIVW